MIYNHPQTLAERFLSNFESLAQIVSSKLLKQSPKDFVSLDTVHGDFCLVQNDGTLVSGIRIDGSRSTVSQEEYEDYKGSQYGIGARESLLVTDRSPAQ